MLMQVSMMLANRPSFAVRMPADGRLKIPPDRRLFRSGYELACALKLNATPGDNIGQLVSDVGPVSKFFSCLAACTIFLHPTRELRKIEANYYIGGLLMIDGQFVHLSLESHGSSPRQGRFPES